MSSGSKNNEFAKWVKTKDNFERGIKLLKELDDSRSDDSDKWLEVTYALAAIERSLKGEEEEEERDERRETVKRAGPSLEGNRGTVRSMFEVWRKWTVEKHAFVDVEMTSQQEHTLSQALKENAGRDEKGALVLPTLRFVKPSKPHNKSVMPKPLTADQLAQNKIFMAQCRLYWNVAQREVRVRLGKILGAHLDNSRGGSEKGARAAALRFLGVAKLAGWAEEDLDAGRAKLKESELEKEDQAKMMHAAFVKSKNQKVIRLSEHDATRPAPAVPRFDLSGGPSVGAGGRRNAPVRPRFSSVSTTTVDLLRGQGMTVVHALARGRAGVEGDLERSRRQLLGQGFVNKANFDAEDFATHPDFDQSKIKTVAKKYCGSKFAAERSRRAAAKREFAQWTEAKEDRDAALKCLRCCESPQQLARSRGCEYALRYWRRMGALLKQVDATLLNEWTHWSRRSSGGGGGGDDTARSSASHKAAAQEDSAETKAQPSNAVFEWAVPLALPVSPATAQALWCALEPRGCDVHRSPACGGVSPLRQALLRILKSGLDLTRALDRLEKRLIHQHTGGAEDCEKPAEDSLLASMVDFRRCCRDGGIALSLEEARLVVDALDDYGGRGRAPLHELRALFGTNSGTAPLF